MLTNVEQDELKHKAKLAQMPAHHSNYLQSISNPQTTTRPITTPQTTHPITTPHTTHPITTSQTTLPITTPKTTTQPITTPQIKLQTSTSVVRPVPVNQRGRLVKSTCVVQ